MDNIKSIEMEFSPKQTANHFFRIFKKNIEALNWGLRLLDHSGEIPERFNDEEEDFIHIQINEPSNTEIIKENLKHILLSKSFEDLIKGLTLSLCDGLTLLTFRKQLCDKKIESKEDFFELYPKIYKKAQSTPFPSLISSIEEIIGNELQYKDEIISINKARNCLIHRDGIVYPEKDINDKENMSLVIKYNEIAIFQKIDGKDVRRSKQFIVEHSSPAFTSNVPKELIFKPYEIISIDYRDIISICMTCYYFINDFVNKQIEFLKKTQKFLPSDIII